MNEKQQNVNEKQQETNAYATMPDAYATKTDAYAMMCAFGIMLHQYTDWLKCGVFFAVWGGAALVARILHR